METTIKINGKIMTVDEWIDSYVYDWRNYRPEQKTRPADYTYTQQCE